MLTMTALSRRANVLAILVLPLLAVPGGCPMRNPANKAPTADAGPDQTIQRGLTVTLTGSGSDPNGFALTYSWTQTAGTPVTLNNADSATASFTAPDVAGGLTFELKVDNGHSGTATDSVVVTVTVPPTPPNQSAQPPTANAGTDQTVAAGASVTLTGSASDPNGYALTYTWTQTAGTSVTLSNANSATATFTAPNTAGALTFQFGVDNGHSGTATDDVTVTVTPPTGSSNIVNTSNSIVTAGGGTRVDPENVASPADTTQVTWKDARGANRTMTLGPYLYQYDFSFDDGQQSVTRSANDDAYGHPGFGFVVSHNTQTGNSPLGKVNTPTSVKTTVFTGGHHAIHHVELVYDRDKEGGGNGIKIPVVIDWLVATGRDHPVWSVTWRMGAAANPNNVDFNVYRMDTRGPYGSLNFDGAATRAQGDAIGGVAWGDFGLRFMSTDAQLTLNSPWTYTTPNTVNFTHAWTATVNAEMGIVQTRPFDKEMGYPDRVVGRERGHTSADNFTNKGDCTGLGDNRNYVMPCIAGWPYQLMNFDWDPGAGKPASEATGTKLIAWGTPYGWLGATTFDLFDYSGSADGRGDRSFATFIVLGAKCRYGQNGVCDQDGDVDVTIQSVAALAAATIDNVSAGSLVTQLPRGPGASDLKTIVNGYNDTYAAYYLSATNNAVAFVFTPAAGQPVKNPIFVIQNYLVRQVPTITFAGSPLTVNTGAADSGAFVSVNDATNELWVTINRTLGASAAIRIGP